MRWYLRFRLSYADVAELLAERGLPVNPSTVYDWVREFAPLYEDAARPFRHAVGSSWSVDETYATIGGQPAYVYRAIDGRGQIVEVYVSERRATEDAVSFFRRAIAATGVVPAEVATDCAAAYPPALAAALPPVAHEIGKAVQQRIERDHQHLKGRLRTMRGFKTLAGARVLCAGHAFLRNLRGHFYEFGAAATATTSAKAPLLHDWDRLTAELLARQAQARASPGSSFPTLIALALSPHNPTEPSTLYPSLLVLFQWAILPLGSSWRHRSPAYGGSAT